MDVTVFSLQRFLGILGGIALTVAMACTTVCANEVSRGCPLNFSALTGPNRTVALTRETYGRLIKSANRPLTPDTIEKIIRDDDPFELPAEETEGREDFVLLIDTGQKRVLARYRLPPGEYYHLEVTSTGGHLLVGRGDELHVVSTSFLRELREVN